VQRDGEWRVEEWPDESLPYVEASIGLLGNAGSVEALGLSLVTRCVGCCCCRLRPPLLPLPLLLLPLLLLPLLLLPLLPLLPPSAALPA
jgi:hypothetical protein